MTGHCPWCGDAFELRGVRLQFCGRPGCRQGWRKHTLGRYSGARNQAIANGTWSSWREWHQPFTPMVCVQTGIADTTEALAQYATEHRTECARAGCKGCAQAVGAAPPPAAVPVAPVAPAAKFGSRLPRPSIAATPVKSPVAAAVSVTLAARRQSSPEFGTSSSSSASLSLGDISPDTFDIDGFDLLERRVTSPKSKYRPAGAACDESQEKYRVTHRVIGTARRIHNRELLKM